MIIKNVDSTKKLSLEEFCHICDQIGEFKDIEDLMKVAKPLVELANNENLLIDFLISELSDLALYQENSTYNIQSLNLATRENYNVRMNFWPTSTEYQLENKNVMSFFAYEFAHDHNFDFITVGYTPRGYETDIYNYSYKELNAGDDIDLTFVGRFELKKGMVMIYEKSKDIHTQFPPQEFAISINLIPKQSNANTQYSIDLESKKINTVIQEGSPLFSLKKLVESIGDKYLIEKLEKRVNEFN